MVNKDHYDILGPYNYNFKDYENSILEVEKHNLSIKTALLMKENIKLEQDPYKNTKLLYEYNSFLMNNNLTINCELSPVKFTEEQKIFLKIKSKFNEFKSEYQKI